ncbi:MAG: FAD:protein FMN transferase [Bacteroidales bacterium]|nr:FAD:protein FMN transferase [Bacteroidales bacterium]
MNNKLLSIVFLLLTILPSCINKKPVIENFTGFIQGTTYSIVFDNKKDLNPVEIKTDVEKILHDFDLSMSIYLDSSIISKVNRNEEVVVDSYFTEVFNESAIISEMTGGAFDITVGPLVKAWGFGPDSQKSFTEEKRDSLLKLVGMNKVSIVNEHVIKSDPNMYLDANAIAQGYSVDVVSRYFDKRGVENYLVEIGGEVRAKGTKGGDLWKIGIDRPEDFNMSPGQNLEAIIKISDKAIATSGNYRKFYVENGVKYSHEINPKTGYPAKNTLLSASIIADECGMADGIATACMVMGTDDAIEFIKTHPQFSAYFIFSDENGNFKTWTSETFKKFVSEAGDK